MAGSVHHKLVELLHRLRRSTAAGLHHAMSLVCSLSRAYAHHQVNDRVSRSRRALAAGRRAVTAPLAIHVVYFLALSCLGYGLLGAIETRGDAPRGIDRFFTAVSAATVSSMSAVEMEVFSNAQLLVITALMLAGGEVFVSLFGLASNVIPYSSLLYTLRRQAVHKSRRVEIHACDVETPTATTTTENADTTPRHVDAARFLFYVVLAILVASHALGAASVAAYVLRLSPSARDTLRAKSLNPWTFAAFVTVSTFSSCGFTPNNENMAAFARDAPLQLLLLPQALLGNTLFPPLLAACVWAATRRRKDLAEKLGGYGYEYYYHLMPARRCWMLCGTVAALVAAQAAMVCGMEWGGGGALRGMSAWEKLVNAVFLAVNSRHTGESTVDLSTLAPAIIVLFVLMMYLPPYTTWFPFEDDSNAKEHTAESQGIRLLKSTVLSQLSNLTIFVIAICITERRKLKEDPLNFNVLSIIVEVVRQWHMLDNNTHQNRHFFFVESDRFIYVCSAYGNVGFSMGYSCSRQINPDHLCIDRWTGFVGRWSDSGKIILIFVMFFGRLKKFSMKGGKSWKLISSQHLPLSMKLPQLNSEVVRNIAEKVKHIHVFISMRALQLVYFVSISFVGFLALKILKPRHKPTPRDLDLMFTSVSTATVSSMATVEMEDFSDQQLWVLILLMLLGGEVFISMLALHFNNAGINTNDILPKRFPSTNRNIESFDAVNNRNQNNSEDCQLSPNWVQESKAMKQKCRNILAHIVLVTGYFIAAVVFSSLIDSDTRHLLKSKDIKIWTFSIFIAVSSFANCGFTPVNDNMVLAGNTMLSPLLRLSIWALGKVSRRQEYFDILQHPEDTGYKYLQPQKNSVRMILTTGGLILLQSMNTRHAGEAVIDISTLSPSILVLFALVMYHPCDNSDLPINADYQHLTKRRRKSNDQAIWKNFIISKSGFLGIFTILACITERKSISADPLNFNIFSIAFEIIRAYANLGYSLGYSCEKLLKLDATCKASSYGFVGKWTDEDTLQHIKSYIAMKLLLLNFEVPQI
uniref:Uncharacterized protein n=1 Tax=Leersia perrieri TaxID=77586 RepID=A0A0D9W965_9ORYZ